MSDARTKQREEAYDDLLRFDPMERVEFSFGMLLDVDEFEVEQAERVLRRRIHQALLHGYGTALGLGVEPLLDESGRAVEAKVLPGWAVDPLGRDIWVDEVMCLQIDKLHEHPIWSELPTDGERRIVWVVARWLGLLNTRIPSAHVASCAPADEGLVYSRHQDSVRIDLSATPPEATPLPPGLLDSAGPGSTRDRWRESIVGASDALSTLVRAWRGPSDAPVLLARLVVEETDGTTEIVEVDQTERPILPAVQPLAEWVAGESLRAVAPFEWFAVESVVAAEDGTDIIFEFDLTEPAHPASLATAVSASVLRPSDDGWQAIDVSGSVSLTESDTRIGVRLDASGLVADTLIEVRISGRAEPLLAADGRALQGSLDTADALTRSGADVIHRIQLPL